MWLLYKWNLTFGNQYFGDTRKDLNCFWENSCLACARITSRKKKHCSREQFFQLERYKGIHKSWFEEGFLRGWGWSAFCILRSIAKSKTRTLNSNPDFPRNQTHPKFQLSPWTEKAWSNWKRLITWEKGFEFTHFSQNGSWTRNRLSKLVPLSSKS